MRRETYSIASPATPNTIKAGRFSREQLLLVPGTYHAQHAPLPGSDDDESGDEDSEDDDDEPPVLPPAHPVHARPQTPGQIHRYSIGDVLRIFRPLSNAIPGNVPHRDGEDAEVTALQFFNQNGTQLATYRIRFTLANGQTRTVTYPAKSPNDDDEDNIDLSEFVTYLHS